MGCKLKTCKKSYLIKTIGREGKQKTNHTYYENVGDKSCEYSLTFNAAERVK